MHKRHRIQFPCTTDVKKMKQDESYFFLLEADKKKKIRFHDYNEIYLRPGLYEQLFYERLKCQSPQKITESLKYTIEQSKSNLTELRVLDLGAGNGMMGEALKKYGVARLVGVDIISEALAAVERDRSGLYDEYYVYDFTTLNKTQKEELESWSFDCLTCVAALGFGDIPPKAFFNALNVISKDAWIALNIKETFLYKSDNSGFSSMIRELIFSEYVDLYHIERYCHRNSIEGKPLYYFSIVGRKNSDIPIEFLKAIEN
ncbi:MAG: class I SAM-dependent methyltransferase [bacterium]